MQERQTPILGAYIGALIFPIVMTMLILIKIPCIGESLCEEVLLIFPMVILTSIFGAIFGYITERIIQEMIKKWKKKRK